MPPPPAKASPPAGVSPAHLRLRTVTRDAHAEVDGLFPSGFGVIDDYRRYLLGMHRFTADYEVAVDAAPRGSAWLARDLATLALPPLAADGVRRPEADHALRLGWDYVMAGSSLGARMLARGARQLGFDADRGGCFLVRHAASNDWRDILARLQALDIGDETRMAAAEAGARAAFALVRDCFARAFDRIPVIAAPVTARTAS